MKERVLTIYSVDHEDTSGQVRRRIVLELGLVEEGVGADGVGYVVHLSAVVEYALGKHERYR
jgi:hypothetical protein